MRGVSWGNSIVSFFCFFFFSSCVGVDGTVSKGKLGQGHVTRVSTRYLHRYSFFFFFFNYLFSFFGVIFLIPSR